MAFRSRPFSVFGGYASASPIHRHSLKSLLASSERQSLSARDAAKPPQWDKTQWPRGVGKTELRTGQRRGLFRDRALFGLRICCFGFAKFQPYQDPVHPNQWLFFWRGAKIFFDSRIFASFRGTVGSGTTLATIFVGATPHYLRISNRRNPAA